MTVSEIDGFIRTLQLQYPSEASSKVKPYVNQFFARTRLGTKIMGKVEGNHGTYRVSIWFDDKQRLNSACSCYIGKGGYCHHCTALARTFLNNIDSFQLLETKTLEKVAALSDVEAYLRGVTLASLLEDLKAAGITQKAFAESIGMNSRHLSSIKSSELRNRYHAELGATKLACLWVLERFAKTAKKKKR